MGSLALIAISLATLTATSAATAQERFSTGDGQAALPAIHRVALIDGEQHRLTLNGEVSYGLTEGVLSGDDIHHRLAGVFSASYFPFSWLALAFAQHLRYDRHIGPPDDGDDGSTFEPWIFLRGGTNLPRGFSLGLEAALWIPPSDSAVSPGAGVSINLLTILTYQLPQTPLLFALNAGYSLNRSAEGATQADTLSLADRLVLGASDAHAVLLGFGLLWRHDPIAIFAEWSWDLLVGDDAPSPAESPMNITGGLRYWPIDTLQLQLLVEGSPSARPPIAQGSPLVVVEPRVTVSFSLSYRFGLANISRPRRSRPIVAGQIFDPSDEAIAGAQIALDDGRDVQRAVSDSAGAFEFEVRPGRPLRISVQAEGFRSYEEAIASPTEGAAPLRVVLDPLPGRVVGLVQTTSETPVANAEVSFSAGQLQQRLTPDAQGRFVVEDVPAGPFEITASAEGFRESTTQGQVTRGGTAEVELTLDRALPEGQISGTVRTMDGTPLRAIIGIDPGDQRINCDDDGTFELTLPPGQYRLRAYVSGYQLHTQTIVVEQDGVVLINVELRAGRRRRQR